MIKTRDGRIIAGNEKQNRFLQRLYGSVSGRLLLKILTFPVLSEIVGKFMDSRLSKPFIRGFVKSNNIDTSQYITDGVCTYNDFFTRKIKDGMRPVDMNANHFISPCDSKLKVYKICSKSVFRIKNSYYKVEDLICDKAIAKNYSGGYCLIFRLEVNDYHRYCYIDDGEKSKNFFIKGVLHTVNPIALEHYNIYKRNCREYTILHTEHFGNVIQTEVGAMMVGKIVNHHKDYIFLKGEEKGMFMFGGSTIVLLVEKNRIKIDDDIMKNSSEGFETVVKFGEKIAVAYEEEL